jgi:TadE-like protein
MNRRGQATVELALCLPVLALLAASVVEIGALAGDRARLWQAAREAARTATVASDVDIVRGAAERSGLRPIEVTVEPVPEYRRQGDPVTVSLTFDPPARVPLLGALFSPIELHAQASMRIEQP